LSRTAKPANRERFFRFALRRKLRRDDGNGGRPMALTNMGAEAAVAARDVLGVEPVYRDAPAALTESVAPTPVPAPDLLHLNRPLARDLRLEPAGLAGEDGVAVLSGNRIPAGSAPVAMGYGGHQFGNWVPELGDGRAVLLGGVTDRDGVLRDLQLKGAGRTPFSGMGDGRAELFPVLGEYLASENMAGLGIPTTRSLAMVGTGETVPRGDYTTGAILTRVATSHIRVGTFEYLARNGDPEGVRTLADYVIARHYPEIGRSDRPYRDLLAEVARRTGDLIARWMLVGFVHGVLNTDNISVVGETLDYGPFAWMDTYHPQQCFSAIDIMGRYAFDQQPRIGSWNLCRFAETLLPLLDDDIEQARTAAYDALDAYDTAFDRTYRDGLCAKIGLEAGDDAGDVELAQSLLSRMAAQHADYTLTFRRLAELPAADRSADGPVRELFDDPEAFDAWAADWRDRLARETRSDSDRIAAMKAVNPAYVLRKHHVYQVYDAVIAGDTDTLDRLWQVLHTPYDDHPDMAAYSRPPAEGEGVRWTFCGT
jgi:uncharacterized protein YdiU (UPF0061 family)